MRYGPTTLALLATWIVAGCATERPSPSDAGMDAEAGMDAAVSCSRTGSEDDVARCTNGCDDDEDGFTDCNDLDCCGLVACGASTACGRDAGAGCDAGCTETGEWACSNGLDDDCDGFTDCNDFSCCSSVMCDSTTSCGRRDGGAPRDAGPPPACDGAVGPETSAAACSDGCSNDGDAFVDCEDRDCCAVRTDCAASTFCGRPPVCAPPCAAGAENTSAACADGCSNDGDAFIDCEDRDCCAVRDDCSPTSFCGRASVDAGPCSAGAENTLGACTDGCSNDGDTFVDCEDRDCCSVRSDCGPSTYCGAM